MAQVRTTKTPTLVLQHQVAHLYLFLDDHLVPCLNHPGIHSGSEDPCTGPAHRVPSNKNSQVSEGFPREETAWTSVMQMLCLTVCEWEIGSLLDTYWDQELLDLLHGVSHAHVGFWDGCRHLNEHMQFHGKMSIFSLTTLPQLFLLKNIKCK